MDRHKPILILDIIRFLEKLEEEIEFFGNQQENIQGYSTIYKYRENTITWLKNKEIYSKEKNNVNHIIKLIVLPRDFQNTEKFLNYIKTDNPHRVFFSIIEEFFTDKITYSTGKNNIISPSAIINEDVYIGHNCVIGENVEIGKGTRIYNNVTISNNVTIGENCIIKSGAVIGEEGLGYIKEKEGKYRRVPHLGSVAIGNNVDIGANTTIERGVMDNTIIEDGVKIDDLCQISHNVFIGENTMIIVNSSIYGSVKIGKNCWISSSIIRNQITLGDNVTVGMGSVVTKDVKDNSVVFGIPAKER